MIPNITRGDQMVGLIAYLAGPGRANEHTNPHLIAGSPGIMAWYDTQELSHEDALGIGAELDQSRRVYDAPWKKPVWHCSLALPEADGELSDEQWAVIATEFMKRMEFIHGVRADVPWVAIHHGLSGGNGETGVRNDHIHIAASLIREDGTRANPRDDAGRAQHACRELEREHGLTHLVSGKGQRSYLQAEYHAAQRRGRNEPERMTCERKVRAFATASASEAEFIRRCRDGGLMLRPNYAPGGTHVRGYAAALRPPEGMDPLYSGGAKMAPDLGLKQLRRLWGADPEVTPPDASAEWDATRFGRTTGVTGRERSMPSAEDFRDAAKELENLRARLRAVQPEDREQWRRVAAFLSGSFAVWSESVGGDTGEHLRHVADELAKSAAVPRGAYRATGDKGPLGLRTATLLALAAQHQGAAGQMAVFTQLGHLLRQFYDAQRATDDALRARGVTRVVREDLMVVTARLDAAVAQWGARDATAVRGVTRVEPRPVVGRVVERTVDERAQERSRNQDRENTR